MERPSMHIKPVLNVPKLKRLMLHYPYLFCIAVLLLASCGQDGKRQVDPVVRDNGYAYIPIDNTAFLIPEKTGLKSYGRNMKDGLISTISLHATIPDVQPWSPERHDEMYAHFVGRHLDILIVGDRGYLQKHFHEVPHSTMFKTKFMEEPSDQVDQGLRRFREI
jgi:hypothetical protein